MDNTAKAQHTPGPWVAAAGYGHHGLRLDGPHGEALGHVRAYIPSGEIRHGQDVWMAWSEGQANARLIAAAPELFAVLELALQYLDHPDVRAIQFALPAEAVADRIRSAIAKATGSAA